MTKENRKVNDKAKTLDQPTMAVPSGRGSRLARLGWMATGIAGSMMAQGARQLAQGNRPKMSDLLLTPANARRVADQLAKLRGAAMKVGQLVSMETGDLLPPALAEILARLRSDARAMPKAQVASVLEANWGKGWEKRFSHFSYTPLACRLDRTGAPRANVRRARPGYQNPIPWRAREHRQRRGQRGGAAALVGLAAP